MIFKKSEVNPSTLIKIRVPLIFNTTGYEYFSKRCYTIDCEIIGCEVLNNEPVYYAVSIPSCDINHYHRFIITKDNINIQNLNTSKCVNTINNSDIIRDDNYRYFIWDCGMLYKTVRVLTDDVTFLYQDNVKIKYQLQTIYEKSKQYLFEVTNTKTHEVNYKLLDETTDETVLKLLGYIVK